MFSPNGKCVLPNHILQIFFPRKIFLSGNGPLSRFSTSEFFRAFSLSVSLITSARRGKMDADKGKRSLRAKKFASGKPALNLAIVGLKTRTI
jgi:hypothetical protein